MVQRPNEDQREHPNVVRSPKVEEKTSCNQQSEPTVVSDEEHGSGLSWPVGTESWHVHEIKPQRTLGVVQEKQRVSHQDCTLANLFQHMSYTEDGATPDSFWPLGNESWFIHEIKPQREPRACKSCAGKLMIPQSTTNNNESSQYLNATTSIDNQSSMFKQKLKITSVCHIVQWSQDRKKN
jgi:hypothetical protein